MDCRYWRMHVKKRSWGGVPRPQPCLLSLLPACVITKHTKIDTYINALFGSCLPLDYLRDGKQMGDAIRLNIIIILFVFRNT